MSESQEVPGTKEPARPAPEKSGLSFNLSELWQQIPRPNSNPEQETSVLIEKPPKVVMGESFSDEQKYIKRIESLIWLTYRTGFEPIPKNENGPSPLQFIHSMVFNKNPLSTNIHSFIDNENFTTDVGWGCMIRTSQSLLANAYQRIIFKTHNDNTLDMYSRESKLIDHFKDTEDAVFSLHNFIKVANESPLQVKPGQWFGPNAASLSIQRLCKAADAQDGELPRMEVLISETSDLYDEKVKQAFDSAADTNVLVLLPIRLGVDKTNKHYFSSILDLLNCKQSVGIAGGRPSSSFYFFGYDNDDLLYLNPHFPQNVDAQYQSYHTSKYQRLNINELDPSMMIGILLGDYEEYQDFKSRCIKNGNKIVHFADSVPAEDGLGASDLDFDDFEDEEGLEIEEEYQLDSGTEDKKPSQPQEEVEEGIIVDRPQSGESNLESHTEEDTTESTKSAT